MRFDSYKRLLILKKASFVLPFLLFLCYGVLPLFSIAGWIFGYRFVLRNYTAYSAALAILSFLLSAILFRSKINLSKIGMVFSALLLPMSAANGICCLSRSRAEPTAIFTLIGCCCAAAVFIKFAGPRALKIVSGIFSALLFLFLILVLVVGALKCNTVTKSVSSPQEKYTVEVIASDQGALGGNTFVEVQDNSQTIDVSVGRFSKPPVRVYAGKWGEFTDMRICWKSEDILVIDGKEYRLGD